MAPSRLISMFNKEWAASDITVLESDVATDFEALINAIHVVIKTSTSI